MAFLEARNIHKSFGNTEILHGIDFSMEKGEVVAIIGSSGGGKTTFLRCLNFLTLPNAGQITVDGKELYDAVKASSYTDALLREKRLHFGLVFQSFNLFPQYTARANIAMPLALRMEERFRVGNSSRRELRAARRAIREEAERRADELLAEVGLAEKRDFYPHELSGGQCQRVAIARALALSPEVLCFDEPTSALDPELTGEVLRVIRELREKNWTMIIVTHEMEFARHVADRVVFIAGGEIVEEGTPEELFNSPKTEALASFLSRNNNF